MPESTCVRDVQKLIGRVVALNRFMSKSAERCLPFHKRCTSERRRRRAKVNLLWSCDDRSALKKILHRLETSGWMLAWSVEINPYCLEYRPRTAVKAQALANFIAECFFNEEQQEQSKESSSSAEGRDGGQPPREFNWKLFMDGASNAGGSGARILLKGPEGLKVCYALRPEFIASNNMAEYETLINGMLMASEVGATDLKISSDSQLVINQITRAYQARDPIMQKYLAKVRAVEVELSKQGIAVQYQMIPREENEEVDLLSWLSEEELEQLPDEVYIQHISTLTFEKPTIVMQIEEEQN
ncbi:uncharacterized protein LOC110608038 [Manihot esculenta]|uniref:uncharacterized protein LOC110608038 n=1 Tax=Manihot esculenta TaxID=3983 RepID=UPI000B5D3C27|nr:uncharacterized protein LOC110608038 [Manihot esculenta]